MRAQPFPTRLRRSRGFTLVELMVAITLSLFLMIGLISLIVSTVSSRSELDKSARQIENGRYALQLLGEDVQLAGFNGTTSTSLTAVLPVACPATLADLGYSAVAAPGPSTIPMPLYDPTTATGYNPATPPACISNVKAGTAMLVVTRTSTTPVSPPASAVATETYLQASACATDTLPFVIGSGAPAASFNLLTCLSSAAPAAVPLRKVVQHLYFVSTCNVCTGAGADTTPTLKMAEYVNGAMTTATTATPLVEGIENLQFDYGIDMDGNGSPDCYVSNPTTQPAVDVVRDAACPQTAPAYDWTAATTNWANVMAVRIHVLARSTEASASWTDTRTYDMGLAVPTLGPFNDHFKRHVYSTVARLYNASGQRE